MKKLLFIFFFLINSLTFANHNIVDCNATYESDINAIFAAIGNNWNDYKSFVENRTGFDLSNCLENRFQSNGDVKCKYLDNNRAGYAIPGLSQIKIDKNWLNRQSATQKNRRACIAALMAHEFSHTCLADEGRAYTIDNPTFHWWKDKYNSTNTWDSCGLAN
ncbi:MAG: hypothetical protein HQK51_17005 [Oligoflexia bacterium]|nr:hypothetical protein [Oligoflexia bacterium]